MRVSRRSASRTSAIVALVSAAVVASLVGPLWREAGAMSMGLPPSQRLTDSSMALLCRPPSDAETFQWETKPFTVSEWSEATRSTDEGVRVRAIRRTYIDVLLRDPFEGDCAGLRRWVDRGDPVADIARHLAASPEARRVADVRQLLATVQGRDPGGWDNASVRRWAQTGLTLAEIAARLLQQRSLVGVHYFTWYPREIVRWGNGGTTLVPDDTQRPTLGWYESSDVAVIDTQLGQMAGAGFDFVIVNVVAEIPNSWDVAHRVFSRLAARGLRAVVMLDGLHEAPASVTAGWAEKVKAEFVGHPNYLSLRGQPLVLLFSARLDFPVPGVQLRNVYWADAYGQGVNRFNPDGLLYPHDWPFWSPTPQPLVNGVVPVLPGYSDAHLGRDGSMEHPRDNGRMYHDQWRRALALHPEFIIVYSWNEHFERTAIEPTDAWGEQYLQWTACYVALAHAGRDGTC